jgi:hypothetical protein
MAMATPRGALSSASTAPAAAEAAARWAAVALYAVCVPGASGVIERSFRFEMIRGLGDCAPPATAGRRKRLARDVRAHLTPPATAGAVLIIHLFIMVQILLFLTSAFAAVGADVWLVESIIITRTILCDLLRLSFAHLAAIHVAKLHNLIVVLCCLNYGGLE